MTGGHNIPYPVNYILELSAWEADPQQVLHEDLQKFKPYLTAGDKSSTRTNSVKIYAGQV